MVNSDTTQDLTNLTSDVYFLTVTDSVGCSTSISIDLTHQLPPSPEICLVTVQPNSQTNLIVWEKPLNNPGIDRYRLYRERVVRPIIINLLLKYLLMI